jgi:hypothetical protein
VGSPAGGESRALAGLDPAVAAAGSVLSPATAGRRETDSGAYKEFVQSGDFTIASADDAVGHHDAVTFTIQLIARDGGVAWAARVVLIVGDDYLIRSDYQFTVIPLAAQ